MLFFRRKVGSAIFMEAATEPTLQDSISDRLGYVLRRASGVMMGALGVALAEIGLRPVEATILILVGANTGCTQSEISRLLGIKRANMVPLMAGLVTKRLIDRYPVDGRSFALSLSPEGVAQRDAADAIMLAHERRFEALFSGEGVDALRTALNRIAQLDTATQE
ncbi:MarR family transcriptional regulator [Sphingomonas populi]|uniref:MarR family transcriptional regulator n=1 Tax=Sphingomonas populi TaxID=2484750 RepID=A0A4Q6XWG0_9SPHN|nr:MarR family winged helix-turn-helix transcriptional regulator [Sphingomonas populi]RZF65053.1 MarR family transcriptional regulator [Sphingomonas populi]